MVCLALAFICVAVLGVVLGSGDLSGGTSSKLGNSELTPLLGLAEIGGSILITGWAIRTAALAIGRIRNPIVLVVGRDGFEYQAGAGPVGWDEVETVSDPGAPDAQPRNVRVQLSDPDDYLRRHNLSPVDRAVFLLARRDLILGRDTIMPVEKVQALMRQRLAESRGLVERRTGISAAAEPRRQKRRAHPAKK
jgi:hypothetical protein